MYIHQVHVSLHRTFCAFVSYLYIMYTLLTVHTLHVYCLHHCRSYQCQTHEQRIENCCCQPQEINWINCPLSILFWVCSLSSKYQHTDYCITMSKRVFCVYCMFARELYTLCIFMHFSFKMWKLFSSACLTDVLKLLLEQGKIGEATMIWQKHQVRTMFTSIISPILMCVLLEQIQ